MSTNPTMTQRQIDAMDWIQRLNEDSANERDVADWLAWYEGDEANRQAFDDMQRFWTGARQLTVSDALLADEPAARIDCIGPLRTRPARRWAVHAAVAAMLALVLAPSALMSPAKRDELVGAASGDFHVLTRHSVLPDGSAIDLAARASVDVSYSEGLRSLVLTGGEAYFTVAPNHARPFIVSSGALRVRAVGTQFDVREEADRVVVAIVEGTVDVSTKNLADHRDGDTLRVSSGNEVIYEKRTHRSTVRALDLSRSATWREGRLDYVHTPLSTVVADLQRYTYGNLAVPDADVARLSYTGTVFLKSVDEWLKAIPKEFPVQIVHRDGETLIMRASGQGNRATR